MLSPTYCLQKQILQQTSIATQYSLELHGRLPSRRAHIALTYGLQVQMQQHSILTKQKPYTRFCRRFLTFPNFFWELTNYYFRKGQKFFVQKFKAKIDNRNSYNWKALIIGTI